jgi:hypothetical protein
MADPKRLRSLKDLIDKTIHSANQEMFLTLPNHLVMAFKAGAHKKDIDPATGEPFASFYAWLRAESPAGVGLGVSAYVNAGDVIRQLERTQDKIPDEHRAALNALIEDLMKGYGAAKDRWGGGKD